jgi:hypothetical protein
MKKHINILLVVAIAVMLTACGKPKTINGVNHPTVGVFTLSERDPNVHYEVSVGNVVWSILLCETIAAPVYFVDWSIMNPVCTEAEWRAKHPYLAH